MLVSFMDVIQREKNWNCPNCSECYSKDIIFCNTCKIFRPLEMFKNLLHDCHHVTEFELHYLDERRKMEKKLVLEQEEDENVDSDDETKHMWFIVSSDWLF